MTTLGSKFLTAEELVNLKTKVDKALPVRGSKEFHPSNSWLEKKQIQTSLDERKFLLEEERVERLGSLTKADWDPELKMANVTCRQGRHWKFMGHEVGGKLQLYPEEALFLLETNCLELTWNGVALSIQQSYSILLGPDSDCTFNEYQTYVHLVRQGYNLLRHSNLIKATRYERKIRLDQHSVGQKQHKLKENYSQHTFHDDNLRKKDQSKIFLNKSEAERRTSNELEIIDVESVDVEEDSIITMTESIDSKQNFKSLHGTLNKALGNENSNILNQCVKQKKTKANEYENVNILPKSEILISEIHSNIESVKELDKNRKVIGNINNTVKKNEVDILVPLLHVKLINNQGTETNNLMNIDIDIENGKGSTVNQNSETNEKTINKKESKNSYVSNSCSVDNMESVMNSIEHLDVKDKSSENTKGNENISDTCISNTNEIPTLGELTDVIIVDDSSASLDVNENDKLVQNDIRTLMNEKENDTRIMVNDNQIKRIDDCAAEFLRTVDTVQCSATDDSVSNQILQSEVENKSPADLKNCSVQSKSVSVTNNEIEIVNITEEKFDLDDEIIEINQEEVPSTSNNQFKSSDNITNNKSCNKNFDNQNSDHIEILKPKVIDITQNETVKVNMTHNIFNLKSKMLDDIENNSITDNFEGSSHNHLNKRRQSNDFSFSGRKKVTNIQLKHEEIEIMSNVIDISEDESKYDIKNFNRETSGFKEIEIVDLEQDEVVPTFETSPEEQRMRILDSIPSFDGKYVVHVKIADKDLLPLNVCPQQQDYYIQKWRLSAPGIGGKEHSVWTSERKYRENADQINPWLQNPTTSYLDGGGNLLGASSSTWMANPGNMFTATGVQNNNSNTPMMPDLLFNHQYLFPLAGAMQLQAALNRAVNMISAFQYPSWMHRGPYNNQQSMSLPYRNRNQYEHRPWRFQSRPYYRRPFYRRRQYPYRRNEPTLYNSNSVRLGEVKNNDNEENIRNKNHSENDVIPLKLETVKNEDLSIKEEDNDIIECHSNSTALKKENNCMEWECENVQSNDKIGLIEKSTTRKHSKRRGSGKGSRYFSPPKKLRRHMENLNSETIEQTTRFRQQREIEDKKDYKLEKDEISEAEMKSWKDLKTVMQVVVIDSSSEDDDSSEEDDIEIDDSSDDTDIVVDDIEGSEAGFKSLVQPEDCKDIGTVLDKLQLIKCVKLDQEKQIFPKTRLKISFDLYLPNIAFRKTSPGLPNYRILVMGHEDPIPEPAEYASLMKHFEDDVPLLIAIVLPNTVSFLQFGSVQLPVETFCP